MIDRDLKIFIAGHTGLVGSSILEALKEKGYHNLIYKSHEQLNLTRQQEVEDFFETTKPEAVILAAAKVGGIKANMSFPGDFAYQNLMIQSNVIHTAYKAHVEKLLFLGSSCIYPKHCEQPMKEEYLLSDYPEPTNEAYAIAKIAGLKMCEYYYEQYKCNFVSCMPCNIYGQKDNFDIETSHVIPSLIRRFHEAKVKNYPKVEIWGSGNAKREFLHVKDLAEACVFLLENYNEKQFINVGTGTDVTIKELAYMIKEITGYAGEVVFDSSKPDGNMRKLLDVSKINKLGWQAKTGLKEGLIYTYQWFLENEIYKEI